MNAAEFRETVFELGQVITTTKGVQLTIIGFVRDMLICDCSGELFTVHRNGYIRYCELALSAEQAVGRAF